MKLNYLKNFEQKNTRAYKVITTDYISLLRRLIIVKSVRELMGCGKSSNILIIQKKIAAIFQ